MAVAVGGAVGGTASGASGVTLPALNVTGSDLLIAVGCASNSDPGSSVSSATWNVGTPENLTAQQNVVYGVYYGNYLGTLVAPTAANNDITISLSGTADDIAAGAVFFTGVDQTTPVGTTSEVDGASGTSHTDDAVGASTGDIILDVMSIQADTGATTLVAGASQTSQVVERSAVAFAIEVGMSTQDPADGDTMSWSWTNTAANNNIIVAVINATATAAAEQEGVRGRNDDGSETTATWIAAQDTDISVAPDDLFRARFVIDFTDDYPSTQFTLEIEEDGTGVWKTVTIE